MEHVAMTPRTAATAQKSVASTLNLLLGVWLFIAGFTLAGGAPAMRNDVILGVLVFIFAAWRMSPRSTAVPSWLNVICGIWLLFAPWALHYTSDSARWNDFAVGCAVIILAIISGSARAAAYDRTTMTTREEIRTPENRRAA